MSRQKKTDKCRKAGSRDKYFTWGDESTEYMLRWYIEFQKDKPIGFKWKQQHHLRCADALNAKFGIGATRKHVYRHFRPLKEKWGWIKQAMGRSGYGFDATLLKFNIDKSEQDGDKIRKEKYNYLTRPIKFFHLLEELFGDSAQADGSQAIDQSTALSDNNEDEEEEESMKELENYALSPSHCGNDSDVIVRQSSTEVTSPRMKRKIFKSPAKKPPKSRRGRSWNDDTAESIRRLVDSITSAAAPDPYANLWKRVEDIPFPARDMIDIASFLCKPEQAQFCSYLSHASDETFRTWVIDYLHGKCFGNGEGTSSI